MTILPRSSKTDEVPGPVATTGTDAAGTIVLEILQLIVTYKLS